MVNFLAGRIAPSPSRFPLAVAVGPEPSFAGSAPLARPSRDVDGIFVIREEPDRITRGGLGSAVVAAEVEADDDDLEMASCVRFREFGTSTSPVAMKPEGVRETEGSPAARAAASCWSRRAFARRRFSSFGVTCQRNSLSSIYTRYLNPKCLMGSVDMDEITRTCDVQCAVWLLVLVGKQVV